MASPTIPTSSEHATGNVFTKPTGLADGDVLYLLYWQFHGATGAATPPTGFTTVAQSVANASPGAGDFWVASIFRKIITNAAGEGANYTVTRGGGTNFADGGEIFRVAGADPTTPEGDSGTATGTSTTFSTGANITTSTDSLLLMMVTTYGVDPGLPSGMTSMFLHDGGDAEAFSEAVTGALSGATRSASMTSQEWHVAWVAIVPTVAGGAPEIALIRGGKLVGGGLLLKGGLRG